jgi:hypothetical protein
VTSASASVLFPPSESRAAVPACTNSGGTDNVWFCDVDADGWSLDDKRTQLLSDDKLGCLPKAKLSAEEMPQCNVVQAVTYS